MSGAQLAHVVFLTSIPVALRLDNARRWRTRSLARRSLVLWAAYVYRVRVLVRTLHALGCENDARALEEVLRRWRRWAQRCRRERVVLHRMRGRALAAAWNTWKEHHRWYVSRQGAGTRVLRALRCDSG